MAPGAGTAADPYMETAFSMFWTCHTGPCTLNGSFKV